MHRSSKAHDDGTGQSGFIELDEDDVAATNKAFASRKRRGYTLDEDSVSKIATLRSGGLISTTHREFLCMGTRLATMCPAHHVDVVDLIEAAVPAVGSTWVASKARIALACTGSRSDEGGKVFSRAY